MQKMNALLKYKGKIIGVLIGLLLKRPVFILIGLAIGHLYDRGMFSSKPTPPSNAPSSGTAGEPDPYAVLGVSEQASQDEIDTAYRRKISDYHPDKVANAADEIKALAEVRAREINAAYEAIQQRRQQP
jgi:preprotein translocase subunit Sec63